MRKLFVIRDVLEGFGVQRGNAPLIIDLPNEDVMIRVVKDSVAVGQKPNILNVHPEDKEIWCIGEIDESTATLKSCTPYCFCRVIDYLGKEKITDENSETSEEANQVD